MALAFLLGIPFDRLADTLSKRLERHHRLQFALNIWDGHKFPATKPAPENNQLEQDIFAEDEFRLQGLRDKDAVVNWISTTGRAFALHARWPFTRLLLTLSLTLSMARSDNVVSHYKIGILLSAVAAGYIVWGIVASPSKRLRQLTQSSSNQSNNESPTKSPLFGEELPRTDHAPFRYYAKNRDRIDDEGRVQKAPRAGVRVWSEEWRSLVIPVLVLVVALFLVFITRAKPRGCRLWCIGDGDLGMDLVEDQHPLSYLPV